MRLIEVAPTGLLARFEQSRGPKIPQPKTNLNPTDGGIRYLGPT